MQASEKDGNLTTEKFLAWLELFIKVLAVWFILSEIFECKFIFFGVASAAIIAAHCLKSCDFKGIKTDKRYYVFHTTPFRFLFYFFGLVKEIIKSSLIVSGVILNGGKAVKSKIIWFRAGYDDPAARALLANSITLTPGTVTIDIFDDGVFSVHALTDAAAEGLLSGEMQKRVAHVFNEDVDYEIIKTEKVSGHAKGTATVPPAKKRYPVRGNIKRLDAVHADARSLGAQSSAVQSLAAQSSDMGRRDAK